MIGLIAIWYTVRGVGGATTPGPASGDGLLLEDGSSFLLLEDGSFLLLE